MPGRDEQTFYRFRTRVDESDLADRFAFLGWVPTEDVPNYYLESDVGINIDRFSYEMLIGCRYRILDMLRAGLPPITTLGTEISTIIRDQRLGETFAPGDAQGLRSAILALARDETRRRGCAARGRDYVFKHRAVGEVMKPLQRWARSPSASPDRQAVVAAEPDTAWTPRSALGRIAQAWETRGTASAARELLRACSAGFADLLAKTFVKRRGAPPWGLDPREPPHATLVMRAGSLAVTREVVEQIVARYPAAEVSVLAPEQLVDETRYELGARVIAAAGVEACGYRITGRLVNSLRERRFDTAMIAGEGSRRAELLALLSGAERRVEVRDDGAGHVFWFAPHKPLALVVQLAVGIVERATLTLLLGLVWGSITAEGWLWNLRRRLAPAGDKA